MKWFANAGSSWDDGKLQGLSSAANDLQLAFDHTATQLRDLAEKCEREQVSVNSFV